MLLKNADTFLPETEIGHYFPEYKKTFNFEGQYINGNHKYYAECQVIDGAILDIGINGWLRRADALKIYELAYFSQGDILEFGTYQGLSTSILSQANYDTGLKKEVHTIEIDNSLLKIARGNLKLRELEKKVIFYRSSSSDAIKTFIRENKKFDFIFIDHSHEYEPVKEVCENMDRLLKEGGFCLFHDYIHPDTFNTTIKDFKVYQAVKDGLSCKKFEFYGLFGCTALFRFEQRPILIAFKDKLNTLIEKDYLK